MCNRAAAGTIPTAAFLALGDVPFVSALWDTPCHWYQSNLSPLRQAACAVKRRGCIPDPSFGHTMAIVLLR